MNCPRCGQPLPDQARFCMACGQMLAIPQGQGAAVMPPMAFPTPRRSKIWLYASLLLAVAALGFSLTASGILRVGGMNPESGLLNDQASRTAGLLKQEGSGSHGLLEENANPNSGLIEEKGPPPAAGMPKAVLDWLEHLHQTELKRRSLTEQQMGMALVDFSMLNSGAEAIKDLLPGAFDPDAPDKDPTTQVKQDAASQRNGWNDLLDFFNSVPPPDECVQIRNEYDQALRETAGMVQDILGIMNTFADNPNDAVGRLMKMRGSSTDRIDKPAARTDVLVFQICNKYSVSKWFDIKTDIGDGMASKFGSF